MLSNLIADNSNTNELNINTNDFTLIIAVICILAILLVGTIALLIIYYNKAKRLSKFVKNNLSNEEINIVLKYRNLTKEERTLFKTTISTFNKNELKPTNYEDDGI